MARNLKAEFEQFDQLNPHVYDQLAIIAMEAYQRRARRRWGIAALFERLRWISEFETVGDPFKLNNNHRAFYARKLMASIPELQDFFQIREQGGM